MNHNISQGAKTKLRIAALVLLVMAMSIYVVRIINSFGNNEQHDSVATSVLFGSYQKTQHQALELPFGWTYKADGGNCSNGTSSIDGFPVSTRRTKCTAVNLDGTVTTK